MNVSGNVIGIDYHQKSVQLCIMGPSGEVRAHRNCPNDVETVLRTIESFGAVHRLAAEACSGAADFLDEIARRKQYSVVLGHPGFVSRMKLNPDKSDKSDGELLADLARVGYLPEVWLAPEEIRDLRTLVRYRFEVVKRLRSVKLQVRALLREQRVFPPENLNLWTKKGMRWLQSSLLDFTSHRRWVCERYLEAIAAYEQELSLVQRRLSEVAAKDAIIKELMREKGLGLITATALRAEVGWVSRFSNGKKLARFCGLCPRNTSSGERQTCAGLVKAGNALLKTALIEVAHHLGKHHPRWKALKEQLIARGKKRSVAIAAIANRFIRSWFYRFVELERTYAL